MSILIKKLSCLGVCSIVLASAVAAPAAAEQAADSFAHGGGFHHAGEWDGGFGPGFVGGFVDPGTGIEKPYRFGGTYGYHDEAPYGYEYGICNTRKETVADARGRRTERQFLDCH